MRASELRISSPRYFDPDSHFLFWKPGSVIRPDPDARSWRLDRATGPNSELAFKANGEE